MTSSIDLVSSNRAIQGTRMFEAKSYNDLRNTFAGANGVFAAVWVILFYETSLVREQRAIFQGILSGIRLDPLLGSILSVALVAGVWGFLTTFLLRLHDRLYEPHLVSWRASYETDYILRALSATYPGRVPEPFFERAHGDQSARTKFMQRLFYKFTGDAKLPHQELLERFYTTIRNYWLLVLAETYCLAFMILSLIYCFLAGQTDAPYRSWASVLIVAILLRVWSNRYLQQIRPITAEQINVVLDEHPEEFRAALGKILEEYNF